VQVLENKLFWSCRILVGDGREGDQKIILTEGVGQEMGIGGGGVSDAAVLGSRVQGAAK
jgi:hypothetical protein